MSLFLTCLNLEKHFGSKTLFNNLSFSISKGERVGLIGPNGAGKSTLLKILAGIETPGSGEISKKSGVTIGYVPQSSTFLSITPKQVLINSIEEDIPSYEKERLAETYLSKLGFTDNEKSADTLSGGWKKRLSIAEALIKKPTVVMLDEPTNHLDLEGVIWLESFLKQEVKSFILVSHDRTFLDNVTNRIIEINQIYPDGLLAIDGSYGNFIKHKESFIEGQIQREKSIATKVRRETEWLRANPKARTTKSQSRIDRAHETFKEHADLKKRNLQKKADIAFTASERKTRKLLVGKNLTKSLGDKLLFENLDITLSPGTRLGLMGPNGCGKTTFLRLITGELVPDQGTIKRADDLKVVYFDQHRTKLPLDKTLREVLSPSGDYVFFQGRSIHVAGWCQRFLFSPEMMDMKLSRLSGGERARIAIAHLMLQPADILLLDEPTNDLDIETLQILESNLLEFTGALILITHDRAMLTNVCSKFLALSQKPAYFAEYSQWVQSIKQESARPKPKKAKPNKEKQKLVQRLERQIEKLEGEIAALQTHLEQETKLEKLQEIQSQIEPLNTKLAKLYTDWEEVQEL